MFQSREGNSQYPTTLTFNFWYLTLENPTSKQVYTLATGLNTYGYQQEIAP